ncbi:MAG: hypothetical protein FH749_12945 [Firmicutes bacterium]|nr:hypothetical protein [Bacillota bacterium]
MSEKLRKRVEKLQATLASRDADLLKLNLLSRILSLPELRSCSDCGHWLEKIDTRLEAVDSDPNRRTRRQYKQALTATMAHLRDSHRLYPQGEPQSNWVGIGILLGTIVGLLFLHDFVPGFFTGLAMGVIIGALREKTLERQNRLY